MKIKFLEGLCLFLLMPFLGSSNYVAEPNYGTFGDFSLEPIYQGADYHFSFKYTCYKKTFVSLKVTWHKENDMENITTLYEKDDLPFNAKRISLTYSLSIKASLINELNRLTFYDQLAGSSLHAVPIVMRVSKPLKDSYDLLSSPSPINGPLSYDVINNVSYTRNYGLEYQGLNNFYGSENSRIVPLSLMRFVWKNFSSTQDDYRLFTNYQVSLIISGLNYKDFLSYGLNKDEKKESLTIPLGLEKINGSPYYHLIVSGVLFYLNLGSGDVRVADGNIQSDEKVETHLLLPTSYGEGRLYNFQVVFSSLNSLKNLSFHFSMYSGLPVFGNCLCSEWCVGVD
jgi:hypothetical protein